MLLGEQKSIPRHGIFSLFFSFLFFFFFSRKHEGKISTILCTEDANGLLFLSYATSGLTQQSVPARAHM